MKRGSGFRDGTLFLCHELLICIYQNEKLLEMHSDRQLLLIFK